MKSLALHPKGGSMGGMEWQVKPIARICAASGKELALGDQVVCVVHKPLGGLMERTDVLKDHLNDFTPSGIILGRWSREVKERGEEEKAQRAQLLASREELFLSLYENEEDPTGEKSILRHILAMLLERKRIIRLQGPAEKGLLPYLHVRTQQVFQVPAIDLKPEDIQRVQGTLDILIG
jgi:hypothetical protein